MSEAGDGIKSKRKTPACVEVGNDSDSVLPPNVLGALKIICTFGIGMEGTPVASRALATVSVVSILMGLLMSYGCKLDKVNAQAFDNYLGRRVYLQSIVVDLASPRDEGGYAATIRVRSAAPLRSAGPRVSESIQSVTERKAHGTSTKPAVRYASGGPPGSPDTAPIAPTRGIHAGQEVVFESVYLWDYQQLRPFCDVELENGQYVYREMTEAYFFRQHSNRCRMASVIDVAFATDGIGDEFSITKPDISINWEDIRRNKGAMAIKGAMLPFPGPSLFKLEQKLENGGAELLNAAEICDPRGLELLRTCSQSF